MVHAKAGLAFFLTVSFEEVFEGKQGFQEKELPYYFDQTTRLLAARLYVATIRGRCLFHWKARWHQRRLDKVCTSDTATTI